MYKASSGRPLSVIVNGTLVVRFCLNVFSDKHAISYCGIHGDERSSADKTVCMLLSKLRNKHIERALVEAAKLAPRQSHQLAVI
jgi:transposase